MFWLLLVAMFIKCDAYSVLHNISTSTDYLSNNIYTNEETLYCNDFETPEDADGVSRTYYYNNSLKLPSNAQTKLKTNKYGNGTDFVLILSYPTVDNNGAYDCCTSYYDYNGTYVKDVCYRRNYIVKESITTALNEKTEIKLSTKRDNYLQIFDAFNGDKNSVINCSFNGGALPKNVKTMNAKNNISSLFNAHIAIYNTVALNFGDYKCNITYQNNTTSVYFKALEDSTRWYPWMKTTTAIITSTASSITLITTTNNAHFCNFSLALSFFIIVAFLFTKILSF